MANSGEAYGFLKYGGKIEDILKYIPAVRNSALTPPELSLTIIEGAENLETKSDSGLAELAERAKGANLNYVFKANLPNADNATTAGELGDMINQLYQTPLYKEGQEFFAEIAYKQDDKYSLLE
ncbi:MAG: hypothetical protein WC852_04345 [Candidatus Nanoarchaeia archaeon]|jgi:hypothetical protein